MIDEATIKRVYAEQTGFDIDVGYGSDIDHMAFARAIEQLARQEQREEDAVICEQEQFDAIATGDPSNAAYNLALDHAASAIRNSGAGRSIKNN